MTRIAFIGDTMLGGEAEETIRLHGYGHVSRGVRPLLEGADLVVANQEGPLTLRSQPQQKSDTGRKRYWYRGRPVAAEALRELGVGVVSLANNHVLDYGRKGLADTIVALDAAGIAHCGAGRDEAAARRPAVVTVGGTRVGFVSAMQRYEIYVRERVYARGARGGCSRLRTRIVREDLAALAAQADVRIALVHWGRNYRGVSGRQARYAAALVEAGADLVVGHHPHISQRVELVDGRPVLYSLGNGILGTPGRFHSGRPPYGLVATVELDGAGHCSALELRLLLVDNAQVAFVPVAAEDDQAWSALRSLVSPSDPWVERNGALRLALARERAAVPSAVEEHLAALDEQRS